MTKEKYIDDYIMDGDDVGALRYLAKEQYKAMNIGGTRKKLLDRVADKLEKMQKKMFDYDECPTRNKKTSSGMFAFQHKCAGRVVVTYEENENYKATCENCGVVFEVKCKSQDSAILKWNRHSLKCKPLEEIVQNKTVAEDDYCCSSYKEKECGLDD